MEKKKQSWKKKRKAILEKKTKKNREGKLEKKMKKCKKKERKSTVDYYCNPQWFRCGETVIPLYHLDIVIIIW
jgi:predicted Holliday junction resolvase-like endonuclease